MQDSDWLEKYYAYRGNMQPLRKKYPNLSLCLHPPRAGKGGYVREQTLAQMRQQLAAEAVREVKRIWRENYPPHKTRTKRNKPTALGVVLAYMEVMLMTRIPHGEVARNPFDGNFDRHDLKGLLAVLRPRGGVTKKSRSQQ